MNTGVSVALLMGGQSRRMGVDKAYLVDPVSGLTSWERQVQLLESLNPDERILSLRQGQTAPDGANAWRPVYDSVVDAGPISGLTACLTAAQQSLVLTLGVDLLAMETAVLGHLLGLASVNTGAVYQNAQGYYEPLAAVYPKSAADSAQNFLTNGRRRLQDWLGQGVETGWMHAVPLSSDEEKAFLNVNTEADYVKLTP